MTKERKIPVIFSTIKGQDGQHQRVPAIPLDDMLDQERPNIQEELGAFAAKYDKLVENCREALLAISLEKKLIKTASPLLYWKLGDYINSFVKDEENSHFFINGFYQQLSKDLKLSQSILRKMLNFRRNLPRREVDTNKTWGYYGSSGKYSRKRNEKAQLR